MAVQKSLFICFLLSALAGIFTIAGKLVVLQMAQRRRRQRQDHRQDHGHARGPQEYLPNSTETDFQISFPNVKPKTTNNTHIIILVCFVVVNILANVCIFLAPWFGPVSIYWPAYIASQLLANMILAGWLQHETFDKPAQIATLVVVAAVMYITLTGPGETNQEENDTTDIKSLVIGNWMAIVWLGLLGLIFCISFVIMMGFLIIHTLRRKQVQKLTGSSTLATASPILSPVVLETVLLLVSTTCSALSATASKAASTLSTDSDDDDATSSSSNNNSLRNGLMATSWLIILAWSIENYLEGRHVRSLGRFLPLMTFGSILLNAATGLIVWNDAQIVTSWTGYITALCLLGLGVYLISDLDFFKAQLKEEQDYYQRHQVMETWQEWFADLQDDLNHARIEQSLSRHQRTILQSEHSRMGSMTRGISDPELGTRGKKMVEEEDGYDEEEITMLNERNGPPPGTPDRLSIMDLSGISTTTSGSLPGGPKSASSFASSNLSVTTPPRPPSHRRGTLRQKSATVRTLDSLERMAASARNLREMDGNQSTVSSASRRTPSRQSSLTTRWASTVTPSMSTMTTPDTIVMVQSSMTSMEKKDNHATSKEVSRSYTAETVSGHSRDSSILTMGGDWDDNYNNDDDDIEVPIADDDEVKMTTTTTTPTPPPPIIATPPRPLRLSSGSRSPYRRPWKGKGSGGSLFSSSPTVVTNHKSLMVVASGDDGNHQNDSSTIVGPSSSSSSSSSTTTTTTSIRRVFSIDSGLGDFNDVQLNEEDDEDVESFSHE